MVCNTYSVRATIPEPENLKIERKRIHEEENECFCEEVYFNCKDLVFSDEVTFERFFGLGSVSLPKLPKIDFR